MSQIGEWYRVSLCFFQNYGDVSRQLIVFISLYKLLHAQYSDSWKIIIFFKLEIVLMLAWHSGSPTGSDGTGIFLAAELWENVLRFPALYECL